MSWLVIRTSLLAAVALAMATPEAGAAIVLNGTLVTPHRVDASTRSVVYYLQMHNNGEREERFSIRLSPGPFSTVGRTEEGRSVDGPRAIALQGPGTIGAVVREGAFAPLCSTRTDRYHGYITGATTVDVLLPPDSATTLAVRFATGRHAPWVDGDYRLTFAARPQLGGTYSESSPFAAGPTPIQPATLRTDGPRVAGRIGVHLVLKTSPSSGRTHADTPRKVRRQTPIRISGRLLPRLVRRTVVLEWSRSGGRLHHLAKVKTDKQGRFHAPTWRLGLHGAYELWARYPRQRGSDADTTSCPIRFIAF